MKKVVHLTSVHGRNDTRIFVKMCSSLRDNGYDVSLIVADGNGDEINSGVTIYDVGPYSNRLARVLFAPKQIFRRCLRLDADLFHLHDPELIPIGLMLKRLGKKVIFDSHEDVPKQLLTKSYLPFFLLKIFSMAFCAFERFSCARFDAIIAATPFIRDKFLKINSYTVDINNFPIIDEMRQSFVGQKRSKVSYVGALSDVRGISEMVNAMIHVGADIKLSIGGNFSNASFAREVRLSPGWGRVEELGFLNREGVGDLLSQSLAGLVTLRPVANYVDSLPVKMFEYMSSGVPVIASDFPLWREIIEGNDCGICVNPLDTKAIAKAIDTLAQDPDMVARMGRNGKKIVHERYNWHKEETKLISLYDNLTR